MAEGSFFSRASQSLSGSGRMLLILGLAAGIAGAGYYFTRTSTPAPTSSLPVPQNLPPTVQGQKPLSEQYHESISKNDGATYAEAQKTGGSAIPTVIAKPNDGLGLDGKLNLKPLDPSPLPRPEQPVVSRPVITPPAAAIPVQFAQQQQQDDNIAELMKRQMEQIAKITFPPATVTYYAKSPAPATATDLATLQRLQAQSAPYVPGAGTDVIDASTGLKVPLAGTILYAELVSEANSDAPGPVVAKLVTGDLAGATLLGTFSTQRDSLVIQFSTLTLATNKQGDEINKTVPISAYAVDSSNVGTALATDVDHHILANVGFTAAAAFAQGFSSALTQSGQQAATTTGGTFVSNPTLTTRQELYVAGGQAVGAAGQTLNQIYGNRPTTIKVASGTAVGVLFMPTNSAK